MKKLSIFFILFCIYVIVGQEKVRVISAAIEAKTLKGKEYITANGTVLYDVNSGKLITHFFKPLEQLSITNYNGEFVQYYKGNNTVSQKMNPEFSSKKSIFYLFLNGKSTDMDLKNSGYVLRKTKNEEGMIITTWQPGKNSNTQSSRIELVHEKSLPIYMGIYDKKGKIGLKVYYSNYVSVSGVMIPQSITEIEFESPKDSIITTREYKDFKVNKNADITYLNYKVPTNAKPVK